MCNNQGCDCITEILNVIYILQKNSDCNDACLETCDRGFLSCNATALNCNTRPVMIYTSCSNGTAWSMPISKDPTITDTSDIFRVEKLEGNCVTFRVLTANTDSDESSIPYVATNSFFTVNMNCFCVIRCLADTYVECI
ncbi:MAG: CotY/CotZ family spore coat protein [Mycoplasmatota bacterium]